MEQFKNECLEYHLKGKTAVEITKPCKTQNELSMAYSPGVAYPCLEIAEDPSLVYKYTNKGNTVAVISNGTAVLGFLDWEILVDWQGSLLWRGKLSSLNLLPMLMLSM